MGSPKPSFRFMPSHFLPFLLFFFGFSSVLCLSAPLNCSDTSRVCTAFIAYKAAAHQSLALILSLFDIWPSEVTMEPIPEADGSRYLFIRKNCSCFSQEKQYMSSTSFTVTENNGPLEEMILRAYDGLVATKPNLNRKAYIGAVVSLRLLCGCSTGLWNYMITYVVREGDTVASLAGRLGVRMEDISNLIGLNAFIVGKVYYIPSMSVPGVPYSPPPAMSPAPPPAALPPLANQGHHSKQFPLGWILGIIGVGLILTLAVLLCIWCKTFHFCSKAQSGNENGGDVKICHKFHFLQGPSFFYPFGRYMCCKSSIAKEKLGSLDKKGIVDSLVWRHASLGHGKHGTFTYSEVVEMTNNFEKAIGRGGSSTVFYGHLKDGQEVAVKKMSSTIVERGIKEFAAEVKMLMQVHHKHLIHFIGYYIDENEMILIYEFMSKGSLHKRLSDETIDALNWRQRLQIALDAAIGLQYLHSGCSPAFIHRDVKSRNILINENFQAKIADFGLSKSIVSDEITHITTAIAGTAGYLDPEYCYTNNVTMKSDVYGFGVVLLELITSRTAISTDVEGQRAPLVQLVRPELKREGIKNVIDPKLEGQYDMNSMVKVAKLAMACTKEKSIMRPTMTEVVTKLKEAMETETSRERSGSGRMGEAPHLHRLLKHH